MMFYITTRLIIFFVMICLFDNCSVNAAGKKHHSKTIRLGFKSPADLKLSSVHVKDINSAFNDVIIKITGTVVNTRYDGERDDVKFKIDDGTGVISVQSFRCRKKLIKKGMLPSVGDKVDVAGIIQTSDRFGNALYFNLDGVYDSQNRSTDLIGAIKKGKNKKAVELIKSGIDLNERGSQGTTALMYAVFLGNKEIVKLLIDNGADVNVENDNGLTTLMMAMKGSANKELLNLLLEHGANINTHNSRGQTALMWAVAYDKIDVVEWLIQHGARVDLKTKDGKTALDLAYEKDKKDIVQLLVKPQGQKPQGQTSTIDRR